MSSKLEGTWRLMAYRYGDAQAFTETEAEPWIHLKYITPTHFIWVYYDRQTHQVAEVGGGVYTLHGDRYSETAQYGMNERFETIRDIQQAFTSTLQDDRWTMAGTLHLGGNAPRTEQIEQIWVRLT